MKLFLIWPTPHPEVEIIIQGLLKAGHQIQYWVGEKPVQHLNPKGTVFHDFYEAWSARPAEVYTERTFDPMPAAEIAKHYELESLILSMMDKRFDKAPVDERKHVYYQLLSYWSTILDEKKPDAIIYGNIPHSVFSNILYELARERGIPTYCFEDPWGWVEGHSLMYRDFWKGSEELREAIKRLSSTRLSPNMLGKDVRDYWERRVEAKEKEEPAAMNIQRSSAEGFSSVVHRMKVLMRTIVDGRVLWLIGERLRRIFKSNLKQEYARVERPADLTVPYVYFPLHFQPELATSPLGGIYHDQILVAETLSAALPEGWELYIKEHPSQWWLRTKEQYNSARYKGYYERLAKIPNVRLVPVKTNTFELTDHSQAVVVITGSVGWQALLRGKSPLVFGIPWYRDCPGIFKVASVEDCVASFKKIQSGAKPSKEGLLAYFKALDEVTAKIYVNVDYTYDPPFSRVENAERTVKYMCSLLNATRQPS